MREVEENNQGLSMALPLTEFPFSKYELNRSEVMDLTSQLPENICEQRMEEFIESLRIRYDLQAAIKARQDGRVHTHEEMKVLFSLEGD